MAYYDQLDWLQNAVNKDNVDSLNKHGETPLIYAVFNKGLRAPFTN
jgi:hypothetical protein